MCKGDAYTPQRFWSYKIARDLHDALNLDKAGYVVSNYKLTKTEVENE